MENNKGKLILASKYTYELLVEDDIESVVIDIARKPIYGADKRYIELAPSKELFNWYQANKENADWFTEYKTRFVKQIMSDSKAIKSLKEIQTMLDEGKDVILLCYCRNVDKCHRSLIGKAYENKKYTVIYK